MKKIAIYGRQFSDKYNDGVKLIFDLLKMRGIEVDVFEDFLGFVKNRVDIDYGATYTRSSFDPSQYDMLVSIGGDGTMLDCTTLVKSSGLPLVGINTGRLGFLSSISLDTVPDALNQMLDGAYMVDRRTVLKVETDDNLFGDLNFALNEITNHKKDSQSMIVIHAYVDGKFLNTYWADGLIIATPTGSTAYSLSCGGPIILPSSNNFIITPVAPHNLSVRPVLISDQSVITLRTEVRSENYLVSLDSRSATVATDTVITVMKSDFTINLIRLKNHSFLKTLRNKLHWGYDRRN
ncbi:MAG: NAD kinase [Salibacteraceae bacterium]